jgi:hypothetical protein
VRSATTCTSASMSDENAALAIDVTPSTSIVSRLIGAIVR